MDMNPMNTPDGTEDVPQKFIPPVDPTAQKFIDLAKKMKGLKPETLACIQKDLQPEEAKKEDMKEDDMEEEGAVEVNLEKSTANVKDPRALLLMGLSKVLGLPTPKN